MNLIADACNGVQFEDMLAIDFYNAINLNPNSKPIIVKKNEKIRVCYLVNQLAELLPQERKVPWIEKVLACVGIDYNYYRAKYRVPVGNLPSEANQEFAETLKGIYSVQIRCKFLIEKRQIIDFQVSTSLLRCPEQNSHIFFLLLSNIF